ncbi:hypothetical protein DSECCO2_08580 [anaerobic digester metagenome]
MRLSISSRQVSRGCGIAITIVLHDPPCTYLDDREDSMAKKELLNTGALLTMSEKHAGSLSMRCLWKNCSDSS